MLSNILDSYVFIAIEAIAVVLITSVALARPRAVSGFLRRAEIKLVKLARRRALSIIIVGLLAGTLRVALLPLEKVPVPGAHDEFSYLLAADTFASGRLTNPTHPLWIHFESLHIIQQPSYMSMYPLGQGLFLALGQALFNQPWFGILLSTALLCAALTWMLQGWLPPQWALLGGLISVARIALFSSWMDGYMGGSVAALGGALLLGAFPRILKRPSIPDALVLALGLGLLANSRPNEGFFLSLGVALVFIPQLLSRYHIVPITKRVVLPVTLVLLLIGLAMGLYFRAVTGSPFHMPYLVNRLHYETAPIFLFASPNPEPHYNNLPMRDYYRWELEVFKHARTPGGLVKHSIGKFFTLWLFYFGPALTLPLIMLPRVLRDRRLRRLVIVGVVSLVGILIPTYFQGHYAAPMTTIMYAFTLQGMRHLRFCKFRGRRGGLLLALSAAVICFAMVCVRTAAGPLHLSTKGDWRYTWCCALRGMMARAQFQEELESLPGQHLVMVRYKPGHDFHTEWVYNKADIDSAKVVWAREIDPQADNELLNYFKGRTVWLLEADEKVPRLVRYPLAPAKPTGQEFAGMGNTKR